MAVDSKSNKIAGYRFYLQRQNMYDNRSIKTEVNFQIINSVLICLSLSQIILSATRINERYDSLALRRRIIYIEHLPYCKVRLLEVADSVCNLEKPSLAIGKMI